MVQKHSQSGRGRLADVDPDHARRRIAAGAVVIDVRELVEWTAGHIPGSTHIPLGDLTKADVPNGQLVLVCRSGNRSAVAAQYLAHQGREVANLLGGLLSWAAAGGPLTSDTGRPPTVL